MAFRHGKFTHFSLQNAAGTVIDISTYLRDVSMPRQIDTAETTAFQSTVKTFVIGIPGATFSVSGMFDLALDTILNGIAGMEAARTWVYGPEGNLATRRRYQGSAYLTNYSITGSVSDMVGFTADFQVTGAITADAFP